MSGKNDVFVEFPISGFTKITFSEITKGNMQTSAIIFDDNENKSIGFFKFRIIYWVMSTYLIVIDQKSNHVYNLLSIL